MRCLTFCEPWAWLIIHGPKRIENRSWYTNHRGPLLIHAGKSERYLTKDSLAHFERLGIPVPNFHLGAILGVVEVTDCKRPGELPPDPFKDGPWCWLLANPKALKEPWPMSGAQRIFEASVPLELLLVAPNQLPPAGEVNSLTERTPPI
jgi:hypothetical protein